MMCRHLRFEVRIVDQVGYVHCLDCGDEKVPMYLAFDNLAKAMYAALAAVQEKRGEGTKKVVVILSVALIAAMEILLITSRWGF